jgi:Spy/CpxP family protein refolding chaperone
MNGTKSLLFSGMLLTASILIAQASGQEQAQQGSAPTEGQGAATGERHARNPAGEARRLTRELGLTAEQEAKIRPILVDRQEKLQNVRAEAYTSPQDQMAKIHVIQEEAKKQIEAVLTDAQKQRYEQMLQQRQEQRQQQQQAQPQ